MSDKPWGRLSMPCIEGRAHKWEDGVAAARYWGRQCLVCEQWMSDLNHYHAYLCEWEWKDEGGLCDFVRERAARLQLRAARSEAKWVELRESYARADARRKERQERWRQRAAEYARQTAARQELRHQRRRLREGHSTLKAIRQILRAPGVRSSLDLASGPAMTSPT